MKAERGDILLAIIPLIAALSFLTTVTILYATAARAMMAEKDTVDERNFALAAMRSLLERIQSDYSPEADSRFDTFMKSDGSESLDDLSEACMARQKEEIDPKRASSMPGYLNPFLVSDDALISAAEKRITGGAGFEALVAKLRSCRPDADGIRQATEAVELCASGLFPLISATAPVNVNFANAELIRNSLTEHGADAGKAELLAREMADLGKTREILPSALLELENSLGIPEKARMAIGTKTWFWKITIRKNGHEYAALACALPDDDCRAVRSMALLSFERTK
jgi:hypothetical protein